MLLGVVAQAQNFAITATTEAAIRKNIVKGNAANYGFGMINDTLKLVGLTTRNVIFTGSTSKTDIGLSNVDNTSDANKPVSTATQTALNLRQTQLNGTGFVKATGTTISYDNSTYLSTSSAASTYLPISNPTATGTLTAPTISNSLGATFATTSGNVGIGTVAPNAKLDVAGNVFASGNNPIVGGTTGVGIGLAGGFPEVYLRDNTAATDTKTWDTYAAGTIMYSRVINDANSNAQAWQQVQRSGATISSVFFPNGNVGIGTTTNEGYKLDVNGTARFANNTIHSGSAAFYNLAPLTFFDVTGIKNVSQRRQSTGEGDANGVAHFGYNGTTYSLGLVEKDNGSVGIGTHSPTSKLQVVGMSVYDSNAAAVAGGLTAGAFYRTSVGVVMCVL